MSDTPDEDDGSGGIKQGVCGFDGSLKVFGQAAVPVKPFEGAFDHPSFGMDDEPVLIGEFAEDLYSDGGSIPDANAVIGAVCIGVLD